MTSAQVAEICLQEHLLKGNPKLSREYLYLPGKEPKLIEINTWDYLISGTLRSRSNYSVLEQRYIMHLATNSQFDSLQRLHEQTIYDDAKPNPPAVYRIYYYYDSIGKLIRVEGTDPNKHNDPFTVITSAERESRIKSDTWYKNGISSYRLVSIRDKSGCVTREERLDRNGVLMELKLMTCNDKGDITSLNIIGEEGCINESWSFKYDFYDKSGNWLKQTKYDAVGKPVLIVQRIIEY